MHDLVGLSHKDGEKPLKTEGKKMTTATELVAGPAEGQNLYIWARQALSESRERAFVNALRTLEDSRFSAEWRAAGQAVDAIEREARMARATEIEAIRTEAHQKVAALEAQIAALRDEQTAIRKASDTAEDAIHSEINKVPALVAARKSSSAIWHRDNDAVEPQRQALVAKYIAAQEKAAK